MSFFGFDTTLPERRNRDEQPGLEGGLTAFADPGGAGVEEDLAVYTWGEDDYDGLGDQLNEEGDDFNDDTFGGGLDDKPVGRDFDFHSSTIAQLDDRPEPRRVAQSHPSAPSTQTGGDSTPARNRSAQPASLEALWADSPPAQPARSSGFLKTTQDVWGVPAASPSRSAPQAMFSSPFDGPIPPSSNSRQGKTLQEIEAEMHMTSKPRPLTMEEIEREMRTRSVGAGQLPPHPSSMQQPHDSPFHQHTSPFQQPAYLHTIPQQQLPGQGSPFTGNQYTLPPHLQQRQPPQGQPMAGFPLAQQQQFQGPPHLGSPLQGQAQPVNLGLMDQSPLPSRPQPSLTSGPPQQLEPQGLQPPSQQQRPPPSFNLADMFPALPGQDGRAPSSTTDMLGALAGLNEEEQALVKVELERKIVEQEKADEKRKRKAWKISRLSQYNDIMTRSDKDFITRIQVSQLVTQDPYADDFYAQVYSAILRSKMGAPSGPVPVLQLGRDGTGVGLGLPGSRGAGRRDYAMQRMTMQVKRIVDAAKQRERVKGDAGLEGALGKISLRSYKTAPRPMLPTQPISEAKSEVPPEPFPQRQAHQGNPLTRRQTLIALENLYELVLQLEQLRRNQPPPQAIDGSDEDQRRVLEWQQAYEAKVQDVWKGLMVNEPVEISFPHPFISLLVPTKGKRLLPRLLRHLSPSQTLTVFTLLLACFTQLDVVWNAPPPLPPYTKDEELREKECDIFLGAVIPAFLAVLDRCELRMVAGMIGLVVQRCDVVMLAKTRPGVVLLTVLLSRAEVLKQGVPGESAPDANELEQWQQSFDALFGQLAPHFPALFPSSHIPHSFGPAMYTARNGGTDALDAPVWQMFGSMALHSNGVQQQTLVGELRDKVLEGVVGAKQSWVDEETSRRRIANVDTFLNALGLSSDMITA